MIQFGTGGFRGIIGDTFTKENVQIVAQALCEIAIEEDSQKPIVIGYDMRFMSDKFALWMAEVFAANGIKSLLYTQPIPSPCVMCATRDLKIDYGIMITASHNPYEFNGVKLFVKGGRDADVVFTGRLEEVCKGIKEVKSIPADEAREKGLISDYSNIEEYVDGIRSFILPEIVDNNAKILYDNLCGVGVVGISRLAKAFNIRQFDILHENHDAFFNFNLPNPTKEMMCSLRERVLEGHYDYAMATDSDGDRLGILDENGDLVSNNEILACLYYYLVEYRNQLGDIVKNCATSILLDKLAKKFGVTCHEVDVGFKNISSKMRETDALIGGESSGGLTCRGYVEGKDSAFSASLFMEMCIRMKKPVSEIVREVCQFAEYDYSCIEMEVPLNDSKCTIEFLGSVMPDLGREIVRVSQFNNNVKYYFNNDCWALLRFSGTEPMLRLFVEAETEKETQRIAAALDKFIHEGPLNLDYDRKVG
ncbi:MAG: phosphoglucomutase/phosphomannomutase family protein [Candidatus Coproplasma sp.]